MCLANPESIREDFNLLQQWIVEYRRRQVLPRVK